jgi:hypothetical protein
MSAIHELSSITPLPEFDIFGVPPTQLTVDRDLVTEHRPISVLNSNSQIQFVIQSAVDEYIQLKETLLYMKIKVNIKKTPTGNILETDWQKIAPVNNLLHSLFKQVDLEIEGKSITLAPQTYAYKAFFETFLGYTKDAKESFLTASGWYDDTGEKAAFSESRSKLIRPTTIDVDGDGKSIELMGKLHLDLAFQPKALLGGTTIKLTLVPNEPSFYLWTKDDKVHPEVEFENASLFVHRSKVNFPVVEGHNLALNNGTAKYPICRSNVKAFNISSGVHDFSIDNAINGQMPRRIFVALVPNDAFKGNILKNPFNFKHYKLDYIAAYIDGTQFPTKAFKPDFENGLYVREYMSLFESLNQITTDSTLTIDKDKWANGNTIFGFNFAPDMGDDCNKMGYVNPIKRGTLRLDLKFTEALKEAIDVLVYCEYDNLIEIDLTRNAITDYI